MTRFRVVLDVDWDQASTDDVREWLTRQLETDAPRTPDWVELDELEDMGT